MAPKGQAEGGLSACPSCGQIIFVGAPTETGDIITLCGHCLSAVYQGKLSDT